VVKGYQDNKGNVLPNAHLLGLFNRLCKLLYYRVKPVFIFDGGVPYLKRETIVSYSEPRQKISSLTTLLFSGQTRKEQKAITK
jgi:DNA excision repair protein ERCC-5